jgi:hypothetical protein
MRNFSYLYFVIILYQKFFEKSNYYIKPFACVLFNVNYIFSFSDSLPPPKI